MYRKSGFKLKNEQETKRKEHIVDRLWGNIFLARCNYAFRLSLSFPRLFHSFLQAKKLRFIDEKRKTLVVPENKDYTRHQRVSSRVEILTLCER